MDEYARAYKEVYEILKILPKELIYVIPIELIKFFYDNMDKNYNFIVSNENIDEENMLEETKVILAIIFREYWATQEQKEKILKFQKTEYERIEKDIEEKYNLNNIFKNKINPNESKKVEDEISLAPVKESVFKKLIKKIKNFFIFKE